MRIYYKAIEQKPSCIPGKPTRPPRWNKRLGTGGEGMRDYSAVTTELQRELSVDPVGGKRNLSEFARTMRGFGADATAEYADFRSTFASQSEELALLFDAGGNNPLSGTSGNDYIAGFDTNDLLAGHAGNDSLVGGGGNDILDGGPGNDSLDGGAGSDTYRFGRGGGQDRIDQNDGAPGKVDAILFDQQRLRAYVFAR